MSRRERCVGGDLLDWAIHVVPPSFKGKHPNTWRVDGGHLSLLQSGDLPFGVRAHDAKSLRSCSGADCRGPSISGRGHHLETVERAAYERECMLTEWLQILRQDGQARWAHQCDVTIPFHGKIVQHTAQDLLTKVLEGQGGPMEQLCHEDSSDLLDRHHFLCRPLRLWGWLVSLRSERDTIAALTNESVQIFWRSSGGISLPTKSWTMRATSCANGSADHCGNVGSSTSVATGAYHRKHRCFPRSERDDGTDRVQEALLKC